MKRSRFRGIAPAAALIMFSGLSGVATAQPGARCPEITERELGFLRGTYTVTALFRTGPASWDSTTATSAIHHELGGCVLREEFDGTRYGAPYRFVATWGANSTPPVSLQRSFTHSQHGIVRVSSGRVHGDTIVLEDSAFARGRWAIEQVIVWRAEDGFHLDGRRSDDARASWVTTLRSTYRRRLSAPAITPGSSLVDGRSIGTYADTVRHFSIRDNVDRPAGSLLDVVRDTMVSGTAMLLRIMRDEQDRTDSILIVRSSLAPVWRRWVSRTERGALAFSGTRVTGSITTESGTPRQVDVSTPVPAFDNQTLPLVLAALPLDVGYKASIALLSEVGTFSWREVEVIEERRVNDRPAWVAQVILNNGDRVLVFIDIATRTEAGVHVVGAPGRGFREVRPRRR